MTDLQKEFEATGYTSWINADLYPDGKIYTQEYTQWLERQVLALRQPPVSGSVFEQIRQAFADYYISEGCSCCRDDAKHREAEKRLAELLKPDMYEDNSGYNWGLYASTDS